MVIELVSGSTYAQQNTEIHLTKAVSYDSTKILRKCHGKWYYEATHKAGGSNYHLIGFEMNIGDIYFYPYANIASPNFFMSSSISHTGSKFTKLPFSVDDRHTVGVGIDVDEHRFYVFYNNNYAYYDFIKTGKCNEMKARVWGSVDPSTDDYVSVNFGDKPFSYNISGFTPWSKNLERITCYQRRKEAKQFVLVVLLMLS